MIVNGYLIKRAQAREGRTPKTRQVLVILVTAQGYRMIKSFRYSTADSARLLYAVEKAVEFAKGRPRPPLVDVELAGQDRAAYWAPPAWNAFRGCHDGPAGDAGEL